MRKPMKHIRTVALLFVSLAHDDSVADVVADAIASAMIEVSARV